MTPAHSAKVPDQSKDKMMSETKTPELPQEIVDAIAAYGLASADILMGHPRSAREALERAIMRALAPVNSHEALVAALHAIIALDHCNMGPEGRATKLARAVLNTVEARHGQ